MKNIVLFASGSGTNAENIISFFRTTATAKVVAVFCNNPNAKVLERAEKLQVPTEIFTKSELNQGNVLQKLQSYRPDCIVLAGFLLQFPKAIIERYPNLILNIHPALLPKYGGKGMYGSHVHQAVLENKEAETGITIHYVNENYDEGNILFQKKVDISDCISAAAIAQKIHELEQNYFPTVIDTFLNSKF